MLGLTGCITSRRLCIYQLEDVYISGTVSPDHLGPHASAYTMLIPELQEELDDFINNDQHVYGDGRYRISCSRFLYYLQKRAITSISQLNYELLLDFHADDYHRSSKSKDVYEDQIRVFLRYCSSKGLCSDGLAIALNKLMIPQIVSLNDNSIITGTENQQKITLSEIDRFLESLSTKKYGLSVMKYSRHILSLLYIFLDMHHLGINVLQVSGSFQENIRNNTSRKLRWIVSLMNSGMQRNFQNKQTKSRLYIVFVMHMLQNE